MDGDAESPIDLAALYPADGRAWVHAKELTVFQAVLLSLDIEPSTIEELAEQRGEDESLHFGRWDDEFNSRIGQVKLALQTTALTPVDGGDTPIRISASILVAWAKAMGWTLPQWMSNGAVAQVAVGAVTDLGVALGSVPTTRVPTQSQGPQAFKPKGSEGLRTALFAFTRDPNNWVKVGGLRRNVVEVCREFHRTLSRSTQCAFKAGRRGLPDIASLQNILTHHRGRGEWEPPDYTSAPPRRSNRPR